jgi:hypothetical protein
VKILINNDRKVVMTLNVQDSSNLWNGKDPYVIQPTEMKLVSIDVPEGEIPYLKIWETGVALLSTINPKVLPEEVK